MINANTYHLCPDHRVEFPHGAECPKCIKEKENNNMNTTQAIAQAILDSVTPINMSFDNNVYGCSQEHVLDILQQVVDGEVTGDRAHRFIGWAQAVLCMEDYIGLNDARDINRKVIEDSK